MPQASVSSHFLQTFKIFSKLILQLIGHNLQTPRRDSEEAQMAFFWYQVTYLWELSVFDVLLPVQEPVWYLEGSWVLKNSHHPLNLEEKPREPRWGHQEIKIIVLGLLHFLPDFKKRKILPVWKVPIKKSLETDYRVSSPLPNSLFLSLFLRLSSAHSKERERSQVGRWGAHPIASLQTNLLCAKKLIGVVEQVNMRCRICSYSLINSLGY